MRQGAALVVSGLLLILVGTASAAPPGLLAGPWRLAKHETVSGRDPEVHLFVRWTPVTEYGPRTGVIATAPIPKRMAFVVDQPRTLRTKVTWFAQCYKNREYPYPHSGEATVTGSRTFYPTLYANRVECDLYVNAVARGAGTLAVRIYGY